MKFFLSFLILFFGLNAFSQVNGLSHYFSFNNCNGSDVQGGEPAFLFGLGNNCECGVEGRALNLTVEAQNAQFPRSIGNTMNGDFTFSFYMWSQGDQNSNDAVDIWTIGDECNSDSIFQVRFFPNNGELRIKFSDQPRNGVELIGFTTDDHCWSYITITKSDRDFALYIDNTLVAQARSNISPSFVPRSDLRLSIGPCDGLPFISPYKGLIDELRIYNRALTKEEIEFENFYPNQIIEETIIIFKGESVFLETGGICSSDFAWSPNEGLSSENEVEPLASPEMTTTYTLEVNDKGCQSLDDIQVVVVDVEDLDCSDLLLPTGFTPNGDRKNDRFGISNGFIIDELISFEIFDRWGGRLFFATETNPTWDGSFRNEVVMPGSYIYRVRYICQGEEFQLNGVVNLIR